MASSEDPEALKRAHYRLGLIGQSNGQFNKSLQSYQRVTEIDPEFCKQQVNLRIAEVCYKLNNTE